MKRGIPELSVARFNCHSKNPPWEVRPSLPYASKPNVFAQCLLVNVSAIPDSVSNCILTSFDTHRFNQRRLW